MPTIVPDTRLSDLEWLLLGLGKTVQITVRTRYKPEFLVRISRKHQPPAAPVYVQAVASTLPAAIELALKAWWDDEDAPENGRRVGSQRVGDLTLESLWEDEDEPLSPGKFPGNLGER